MLSFNRRAPRTWRLVLSAALLGAALVLLTACNGSLEIGSKGRSEVGSGGGSEVSRGGGGSGGASDPYGTTEGGTARVADDQYGTTGGGTTGVADDQYDTPGGTPTSAEQKVLHDATQVENLLNDFWTQELRAQYGVQFDTPDRYEYYRGATNAPCGGEGGRDAAENAYYCFAESDEYVAFDLDWFTSYLDEHPGGATTFLILAHEWGHAVQDTLIEQQIHPEEWNPGYLQELHADCLAGVWMEDALRRGTVIEESGDADAIFGFLWEAGSGPWFAPGDHGTKEQRQQAFSDGFAKGTDYCQTNY